MYYTAVIEIPKGCDRRIHKSIETHEFVDFGPTKEVIPVNEGVMPVHYGFIKNTLNKDERDEIDVIVFSNKKYKTGDEFSIEILGMIVRDDGDNKIIAKDVDCTISTISDIPRDEWRLILEFFGYKHNIISVEEREKALEYLELNKTI